MIREIVFVGNGDDLSSEIETQLSFFGCEIKHESLSGLTKWLSKTNFVPIIFDQMEDLISFSTTLKGMGSELPLILVGKKSDAVPEETIFIEGKSSLSDFLTAIDKCVMSHQSKISSVDLQSDSHYAVSSIIKGMSEKTLELKHETVLAASSNVNVLLRGESGTGKEVVATAIHAASARSGSMFIAVNCGAIPRELIESELFGHEKGSFTGAFDTKVGKFEQANGGTILLDEIGDMPMDVQVKLLRVLQEREITRVGGNKSIPVDVRVIAATHKNIEELIANNLFREDLYFRLNVFSIDLPPLRDRIEDVPVLIKEMNSRNRQKNVGEVFFSPQAQLSLIQNNWKGNIRELSNLIEYLAARYPNSVICRDMLPEAFQKDVISTDTIPFLSKPTGEETIQTKSSVTANSMMNPLEALCQNVLGDNMREAVALMEKTLIVHAMRMNDENVHHAAIFLSTKRTTLSQKVAKYCADREFKDSLVITKVVESDYIKQRDKLDLKEILVEVECHYIRLAVAKYPDSRTKASKELSIPRTSLNEKIERFNILG